MLQWIVLENTPLTDAFLVADNILRQGVVGISEIIIKTGLVNVDFTNVRAVTNDASTVLVGVGTGIGKNRTTKAAVTAISRPLVDFPISKVDRVQRCGQEWLSDIDATSDVIYKNVDEDANIISDMGMRLVLRCLRVIFGS